MKYVEKTKNLKSARSIAGGLKRDPAFKNVMVTTQKLGKIVYPKGLSSFKKRQKHSKGLLGLGFGGL